METNDILNKFRLIAQAKKNVNLINAYKGIHLELDATISNICGNTVTFNVHDYQLASFAFQKQIFMQNDLFPETVKAKIQEIHIVKKYVILADFEYVTVPIVKRRATRIQPENSVEVTIFKHGDAGIKAELVDISECGIGVCMIQPLLVHTKVYIHLQLSDTETNTHWKLELPGTVVMHFIQKDDPQGGIRHRIGMQIFPDERTKRGIMEYISRQQAKLLNELKQYYDKLAQQ
jgi:hypothetical protein